MAARGQTIFTTAWPSGPSLSKAMVAPVRTLAGELGGIFHAPWWAMVLVTPAVAALLAWSAAVVAALARARPRRPARDAGPAA